MDTAGEEEFDALLTQWIRDSEGFILIYSLTSSQTFEEMKFYIDQIRIIKTESNFIPMVMIGNKLDLNDERTVSFKEAKKFANSEGIPLFEISAKTRQNVEDSFFEVVRMMRHNRNRNLYYFTGKEIDKLFLPIVNLSNIETPFYNKNLKNVWMIIFSYLFFDKNKNLLEKKKERLNCKLVCKYWYDLILKNFETKTEIMEKEIDFGNFSCFKICFQIVPLDSLSLSKYIIFINICDFLEDQSTHKNLEMLRDVQNRYQLSKRDIFVVLFNKKLFSTIFDKQKQKDKKEKAKKIISGIVKSFSNFTVIDVEDLSKKNITSIFKKIDPKNYKKFQI